MKAITRLVSRLPLAGKFAVQPMTRLVVAKELRMDIYFAFIAIMIGLHSFQVWLGMSIATRSHFLVSAFAIVYAIVNAMVVMTQSDIVVRVCRLKLRKRKFTIKVPEVSFFEFLNATIITGGANILMIHFL